MEWYVKNRWWIWTVTGFILLTELLPAFTIPKDKN